jgi:hypothetical protein
LRARASAGCAALRRQEPSGRIYLKHNTFGSDDLPLMVVLKAMGVGSDQEAVQLVGSDALVQDAMGASVEEAYSLGVLTREQVPQPGRPVGRPTDRSTDRSTDQRTGRPTDRPNDRPNDQPNDPGG